MKLFRYFICASFFAYCGCSDATTKEKNSDLSCPAFLSVEKNVPDNWVILGKIPSEKLTIRSAGIILAKASEVKDRKYTEEVIDEWDDSNGKTQAVLDYDENHEDRSLKCIYAKSDKGVSDNDSNNVVLLISIPSKKAVTCLLVMNDGSPQAEASCKIK